MKKYKYGIAVSGSHGKTTTTSLISVIFNGMGYDPTVLVGGEVDVIGGNVRVGNSEYFVTEACEYTDSFLKFYPYIAVILNVDSDHLDYFKNIDNIKQSFRQFASLVPPDGYVVACKDDANTMYVVNGLNKNIVTYGIYKDSDWKAKNIGFDDKGCAIFDVYYKEEYMGNFKLSIPGKHNVYNALAALAVSHLVGIDIKKASHYLTEFKGIHRRFEIKGIVDGITIVDDYAHHPAEIKATLEAAKNYPHKRIICIFQPHTYSRTKALLNEFAESFDNADKIIIADIYAAREKDTGIVSSKDLVELISQKGKDVLYLKDFDSIMEYLNKNAKAGDLVLTIGAGNIYEVGEMFLKDYKKAVGM
jgi:UDP-N-acetylmuramate--alanine ligase